MYISKDKMSFEEAQKAFLEEIFDGLGVFEMDSHYVGYSEWTITGFDLDKCQLGGHNMDDILHSHMGKYANIYIQCW